MSEQGFSSASPNRGRVASWRVSLVERVPDRWVGEWECIDFDAHAREMVELVERLDPFADVASVMRSLPDPQSWKRRGLSFVRTFACGCFVKVSPA